ncbi:hypothetical protein V8C86DRAFT_3028630 [Haematococcus lacustris]
MTRHCSEPLSMSPPGPSKPWQLLSGELGCPLPPPPRPWQLLSGELGCPLPPPPRPWQLLAGELGCPLPPPPRPWQLLSGELGCPLPPPPRPWQLLAGELGCPLPPPPRPWQLLARRHPAAGSGARASPSTTEDIVTAFLILGARNPSHGVLNSCNVFASIAGAHKKHAMQQAMAAWGQLPKATKDLYKQTAKHINDVQGRAQSAQTVTGLFAHMTRCASAEQRRWQLAPLNVAPWP